jgi:hypothetical protein
LLKRYDAKALSSKIDAGRQQEKKLAIFLRRLAKAAVAALRTRMNSVIYGSRLKYVLWLKKLRTYVVVWRFNTH